MKTIKHCLLVAQHLESCDKSRKLERA